METYYTGNRFAAPGQLERHGAAKTIANRCNLRLIDLAMRNQCVQAALCPRPDMDGFIP